ENGRMGENGVTSCIVNKFDAAFLLYPSQSLPKTLARERVLGLIFVIALSRNIMVNAHEKSILTPNDENLAKNKKKYKKCLSQRYKAHKAKIK
ncbi:MAG: hypothetical protein V1753_02070, partial [Pseudomonadota bacterium]